MNTTTTSTGTIVVGVDGSEASTRALVWAATEAGLHQRELTIVHAEKTFSTSEQAWLASSGITPGEIADQVLAEAREVVDRARSRALSERPGLEVSTILQVGDARDVLHGLADNATMIVVGSRGLGPVTSVLLGSVSIAVSRHAACPVVVVRPSEVDQEHRGVVVGTDGSEASIPTVEYAYREASLHHMPLTVVHCLWDPLVARVRWGHLTPGDPFYEDAEQRVSSSLAGISDKFPEVETHVALAKGAVDACLVDFSRQHDILVLGRHGQSLGERLAWGGLTTSIVEHASGPVVVVP